MSPCDLTRLWKMRGCALGSYWCRHIEVVSQTLSKAEARSFLLCYKRVMVMDIRVWLMLIFGADTNADLKKLPQRYTNPILTFFFFAMSPWISPSAPSQHTMAIKIVIFGGSPSSAMLLAIPHGACLTRSCSCSKLENKGKRRLNTKILRIYLKKWLWTPF